MPIDLRHPAAALRLGAKHKYCRQAGMTRAQWDDSISLMIRRHNMPPLDDKDRSVALNYLEAAYPPRAAAGRARWQNPFAK
jgi:hypothetical protein